MNRPSGLSLPPSPPPPPSLSFSLSSLCSPPSFWMCLSILVSKLNYYLNQPTSRRIIDPVNFRQCFSNKYGYDLAVKMFLEDCMTHWTCFTLPHTPVPALQLFPAVPCTSSGTHIYTAHWPTVVGTQAEETWDRIVLNTCCETPVTVAIH